MYWLDINNRGRDYDFRGESMHSDYLGNFGAAYALSDRYGPLGAVVLCLSAELAVGIMNNNLSWDDARGSFEANFRGILQQQRDMWVWWL